MEVTKDLEMSLENSFLMQSLLDPTSPTFFDRPLPDCLFSDEDTEKQTAVQEPCDLPSKPSRPLVAAVCKEPPKETGEGIKLRLKLEKSESNYVAFVNLPVAPSKLATQNVPDPAANSSLSNSSGGSSPATEPRVPPLHISLKGRNLAVLNSPKKDMKRKKSRSRHESAEEDDFHRGISHFCSQNLVGIVIDSHFEMQARRKASKGKSHNN